MAAPAMREVGWLWESRWAACAYGGIKYVRNLVKICNEVWEDHSVWDGLNCTGFVLSVMWDI